MIALTMAHRRNRGRTAQDKALKKARGRANLRIVFLGHVVIWGATSIFLLFVAGFGGVIASMAWGIGVAAHGFFTVLAPVLRDRWVNEEVSAQVFTSAVEQRRQLGQEHSRAMQELSASLAHDIRNPITAAKSLVQQMGEDPNCDQNVEYARVAIEELDRVERSISTLLRFARDEPLEMTEIHLNDVVESALGSFHDRLDGIEVSRELHPDDTLRGDPEKLRRVVINLVGNALDALEEVSSEPKLSLSTGQDLAGKHVWLRVGDNGCGIDPQRVCDIFTPFHTSKERGTGLGLAICKKLVEVHGGTLEVASKAVGTDMVVTLPIGRDA